MIKMSTLTVGGITHEIVDEQARDDIYKLKRLSNSNVLATGNAVFIGDSVGQGYNNNDYSYINVAAELGDFNSVTKAAVGGATIGNYSMVQAATGYSGVEQVSKNADAIELASHVFIQFGANDVQSLMNGKVQLGSDADNSSATTVCGYVKKMIESIYELNPNVQIHFLNAFYSEECMKLGATAYGNYFTNVFGQTFDEYSFIRWYKKWNTVVIPLIRSYGISIINIFEGINGNDITKPYLFTDDYIHPNNYGHKRIYYKIIENLFNDERTEEYQSKDYVIEVVTSNGVNFTTDSLFEDAMLAHQCGKRVVFKCDQFHGSYVEATSFQEEAISCSVVTRFDPSNIVLVVVNFISNETIEMYQIPLKTS